MILLNNFHKFVPSQACLACDGCCRFQDKKSVWRPRPSQEEVSLCRCYAQSTDSQGYIKTNASCDGVICQFFSPDNSHCQIYENRPLECQLYPFMLTRRGKKIFLSVHTFCPYVQQKNGTKEFGEYVEYLKEFFAQPEILELMRRNPELAGDYEGHEDELTLLFELPGDSPRSREGLLQHKNIIQRFLAEAPSELSSFSFAAIFLWKDFFNFELREIDSNLCIFASHPAGTFLYLPPLGKTISPKAIQESFDLMNQRNKNPGVSRIENVQEFQLSGFPSRKYIRHKKSDEYLYERQAVAQLRGVALKSKRNAYNHFVKNYQASFIPYEPAMQSQCQALYEAWAQERYARYPEEIYRQMLRENYHVHALALENYKALDLIGRVVIVESKLCGYTFGYALDKNIFCVLLEVTDFEKKGLPAYIFREFCADAAVKNFRWINVMDDFGMNNLKATKLSFRPTRIISSYTVTKKQNPNEK